MVERSILRLPNPRAARRKPGSKRSIPRPRGPGTTRQGQRFQPTFDRLSAALDGEEASVELRADPAGVAPERALVFVTAGEIQGFARAAQAVGLDVVMELGLEATEEVPEGFTPPAADAVLHPILYATVPTLDTLEQILRLWRAYQTGERPPHGAAPWWAVFELLLELRPWGPQDRFPEGVRAALQDRLPIDDAEEVLLELEIVPTHRVEQRQSWRRETEERIANLNGRVVDRCSIDSTEFVYEALLVGLSASVVRALINNPEDLNGLAALDGIQFIVAPTVGQAPPADPSAPSAELERSVAPNVAGPVRAALIDGTPVAAHPLLDGAIEIEDVHDLVRLSPVDQRYHATGMASLIVRGDLEADASPLTESRVVAVPVLSDSGGLATSPRERLLIDLIYGALVRLTSGSQPHAPSVFVINLAIGVYESRFSGRMSALARLIDWWSWREGVVFVLAAGNIPDGLRLPGASPAEFETADIGERQQIVGQALRDSAYERTLMSPAESLNGVTVGALSKDLSADQDPPGAAGILRIDDDVTDVPAVSSALGLGLFRAIKPDFVLAGGVHEVRVLPSPGGAQLRVAPSQRTGLYVASPSRTAAVPVRRERGTSCAAALTTRAMLRCAEVLMGEDGPYQGQELTRRQIALLTRALAVNACRWPETARSLYDTELARLGGHHHRRAKEEVSRRFGHGVLDPELMAESPQQGVTLVGLGALKKDEAQVFDLPLPPSLSGQRVPRSMRVTLAWFSPVDSARARYRLASLEAVASDPDGDSDEEVDKGWGLHLKGYGPDQNMVKLGTVWSRRLVHERLTAPAFGSGATVPVRVQCRDAAGNLHPDTDIDFAIAVTLELESAVQFDVHQEIAARLRAQARATG